MMGVGCSKVVSPPYAPHIFRDLPVVYSRVGRAEGGPVTHLKREQLPFARELKAYPWIAQIATGFSEVSY